MRVSEALRMHFIRQPGPTTGGSALEIEIADWPMIKDSSLHLIFNLKGEGLVMAADTRLTLLPNTSAIFSSSFCSCKYF
jgi:hypothetical protein